MGITWGLSHFLGWSEDKKVDFGSLASVRATLCWPKRRPDEHWQRDRWGHLKLAGAQTLVAEQPRAGRDAGRIVSIPPSCQRVSLTPGEPATLTSNINHTRFPGGDAHFQRQRRKPPCWVKTGGTPHFRVRRGKKIGCVEASVALSGCFIGAVGWVARGAVPTAIPSRRE